MAVLVAAWQSTVTEPEREHLRPNNAMKLTRGGLERMRGMVAASRHEVAVAKEHGAVVRPSQLIASVGQT